MAALRAGQILDGTPYRVVRELGAGGMGVVYEVEHVRLKKHYVAKVIHDQIRGEESAQKRIEREADVLGKINHPNIVQVHDVGATPDGTSYFVMEKLEGMDLRQAMKRGGVGRARATAIVIDILDALEHVHQRGIVHRDVKPENVFLAQHPHGVVTKVLDFGIVHLFGEDAKSSQSRITKTGGFVGTLYYAAPEQMQGAPTAPASDVYAAGLVLYELIAGRGPFDDDPGVGLARCFKSAPRLDGDPALADAVAAALEQDPARRPRAGQLAQMLRHALAGIAPGAGSVLRGQVDSLLGGVAETAMPRTPLMRDAPRAGAPSDLGLEPTIASGIGPAFSLPPDSPRVAPAVTMGSAGRDPAPVTGRMPYTPGGGPVSTMPQLDTNPGIAATVDGGTPFPRRASAATAFGAIAALLVVAGVLASIVVGLVMRRPRAAQVEAPIVAVQPAAAPVPPPVTGTVTAPEEPVAIPSVAPSASAPRPAAAKPAPAKARNAEKDGYLKDL